MSDTTDFSAAEPFRKELVAHCYRILGSRADAEDAVQDALVRAWRGMPTFEGRSSLRRWLYTIATRTSLDLAATRRRRSLAAFDQPPSALEREMKPPVLDPVWIEPIADDAIDVTADDAPSPEARFSARESVRLAFLVALQRLPARQRATLILRDVVGLSAEETAEILETSVPSVNSALQRAREAIDDDANVPTKKTPPNHDVEALLTRFVTALESRDAVSLASMLRHDVVYSMPPFPLWLQGIAMVQALFTQVVFPQGALRVLRTQANGSPAFGLYQQSDAGPFVPFGLSVVDVAGGEDGDRIAAVHTFLTVDPRLDVSRFGLPRSL